jgi:hypothetical protein
MVYVLGTFLLTQGLSREGAVTKLEGALRTKTLASKTNLTISVCIGSAVLFSHLVVSLSFYFSLGRWLYIS